MGAGICNSSITMLSPYKMCMHQLYPPPQLKHQYIDYTNGSSIVSGQKIHVDFDYGNGLDWWLLWKAILSIVGHHTLFVWLKMAICHRDFYNIYQPGKYSLMGGMKAGIKGFV